MIPLIVTGITIITVLAAICTSVYLQYRSQNGVIRITNERPISVQYISPLPAVDKFLPVSRSTPKFINAPQNYQQFRGNNSNLKFRSFEQHYPNLDHVDNQQNESTNLYESEKDVFSNASFNKSISERSKKEDSVRRQFTVKLQPIPRVATPKIVPPISSMPQTSESITLENSELSSIQPLNDVDTEMLNEKIERTQKRRIEHEDESPLKHQTDLLAPKKTKNTVSTSKISLPLNKMKRRIGLAPEDDMVYDMPVKRVRNNEIFSSYSSSLKRSASGATEFQIPKKRTVLEELELLSSQDSPYIQNVYGGSSTGSDKKSPKTETKKTQDEPKFVVESTSVTEFTIENDSDIPHTIIEKISEEIIENDEKAKEYDSFSESDEETPKYEAPLITKKEVQHDREKDRKRLNNFLKAVEADLKPIAETSTPPPLPTCL